MENKSSEVFKNLRVAEINLSGYRRGDLERGEVEFMYHDISMSVWPQDIPCGDFITHKRCMILRCEDDPEWWGCLSEFGLNKQLEILRDGQYSDHIRVGEYIDVVVTDDNVRLINVLDHIPEIFK